MFFDGDLQAGISLAIQQQKLVACLVRQEDDETSQKWENEWLASSPESIEQDGSSQSLGSRLAEKAVFLRIEAGTTEAGFLSAFCSLDTIPRTVVISQGIVVADIDSTTSRSDFEKRLLAVINPQTTAPTIQNDTNSAAPTIQNDGDTAAADVSQLLPNVPLVGEQASSLQEPATEDSQEAARLQEQEQEQRRVQALLSERGARLEAERKKQLEAEKEARKSAAKAKKEAEEKQNATKGDGESSSTGHKRQEWLEQQRSRQQEAKLDRERILKTIESDRQARRARDEQRRLIAQGERAGTSATAQPQETSQTGISQGRASATCALQIRLFDGTSLRTRFDSSATLATAVRTYVSEQSKTDIPYNFRQMLTPNPSRTIELGEENESLQSLGLTPSATLVLIPVKGYTEAYAAGGTSGLLSRSFNAGYGLLSGAVGLVGSAVGGIIGGGQTNTQGPYMAGMGDEKEPSNSQGSRMAAESGNGAAGVKIRTLADQRREADKTELYNGNQLNFEPRKKDDASDSEG